MKGWAVCFPNRPLLWGVMRCHCSCLRHGGPVKRRGKGINKDGGKMAEKDGPNYSNELIFCP